MTPAKIKFNIQKNINGLNSSVNVKAELLGSKDGTENLGQATELNKVVAASTGPDGVKRNTDTNTISWKQAAIYANMAKVARTGFNFAVANYGDLTGDYAGGIRLQESLDIVSSGIGIVAGFAVGGPVGGIAAAVGVALDYATQLGTDIIRTNKQNATAGVMRERYGIATKGGGR